MRIIKRNYDSAYFNTWLEQMPLEKMFNKSKLKLIRSLKSSGKLLEIGCGRGLLLGELKKDFSVYGTDISESAIKESAKMIDKSRLKVSNIEKNPIRGKYDVILAFDVLEHLKNPEKVLVNIRNSLNKNGIFIFSVPNNYGLFGKLMTKFFNYTDKTHVSTYERGKWIKLMNKVGFNVDARSQHLFGISKLSVAKHLAFNLIVIGRRK